MGAGAVEPGAALANASVLQGALAGGSIGALLSVFYVLASVPAITEDNQQRRSAASEALEASGMNSYDAFSAVQHAPQGQLKCILAAHPIEQDIDQ